jgi:hypothetical protein
MPCAVVPSSLEFHFDDQCYLLHCDAESRSIGFRASPVVLSMWFCTVKLDEENPMFASLAQENGFGSA